jgi:hypothetical protein
VHGVSHKGKSRKEYLILSLTIRMVLFPCDKQLPSQSSGFLHPHDEKSNGIVFDDIHHSLSEIDQVVQLFM